MYIVLHTANGVGFVTRVNSDEALKEHIEWLLDNAWPFSLSYGNQQPTAIWKVFMFSIYFKDNTARTVSIELPDLLEARHYWDRLSHVFYMVSTRP
jgi:hypothetical protein